jgi:hypothetical protein
MTRPSKPKRQVSFATVENMTAADGSDNQWAKLEAAAAKLGLSTEEFLAERLTDLADNDPERYAELTDTLASSALNIVRLLRKVSAKLPHIEAEVQVSNNAEALDLMRAIRSNIDDLLESNSEIALIGGTTTSSRA